MRINQLHPNSPQYNLIQRTEFLIGKSGSESIYRTALRILSITSFSLIFALHLHTLKEDKENNPEIQNFRPYSLSPKDHKYAYSYILKTFAICLIVEEVLTLIEYIIYFCQKKRVPVHNHILTITTIIFLSLIAYSLQTGKPWIFFVTLGIKFLFVFVLLLSFFKSYPNDIYETYASESFAINFQIDIFFFFLALKIFGVYSSFYLATLPLILYGSVIAIFGLKILWQLGRKYFADFYGKK